MSTVGVQFRIMPKSTDTNLKKLKKEIKTKIESFESGVFNEIKEEPIAFGLNALLVTLALSENQEVDIVENSIRELEGISSVELVDYRKAVG